MDYRYEDSKLLVATDSGDIEIWMISQPDSIFRSCGLLSSCHNDMALCISVSASCDSGKCKAVSGGADGRYS